jgi:protein farnesyltransferase subunit beta
VRPLQNARGGYGGGHGQLSHCAASYAVVLSLAMVDGLDEVNRTAMWHWLGNLKQPKGGFTMAEGAEEDLRGAFCAFIIITVLNLPLDLPPAAPARQAGLTSFSDNLGTYIGSLQTFEGGIGAAPPAAEAHGAYVFLAMGTLALLDAPHKSIPKYVNLPLLLHWLAQQQTAPEGGFAGRTNKLVDACYSQWIGGTWALVEAALNGPGERSEAMNGNEASNSRRTPSLWNRAGLVRYLLTCAQQPGKRGGMRDKPSTRPDGYHTTYSLAGLSAAMNHYTCSPHPPSGTTTAAGKQGNGEEGGGRLEAAFRWKAERGSREEMAALGLEERDWVGFVHPVFVVPFGVVEGFRGKFEGRGL